MNGLPDPQITIGPRRVGRGLPCFIIAEIGTSHGGDPERAADLIGAAAEAGADCVKTQAVFADEILHPACGPVDLPGGRIPLYEQFRRLERGIDFYRAMKERAEEKNMVFLCTPFGAGSAEILRILEVQAVKIASPELNHYPLLAAASFGPPIILSTGVSTLGDIEHALSVLKVPAALLHCVTAYPAPPEDYNLRCMEHLSKIFGVPVGVSDHTADPLQVPLTAAAYGGCMIEKHMTLTRDGRGLDDPFALEPEDFSHMVREVRLLETLPAEERGKTPEELFGAETVKTILGDGIKRLSPAEEHNYRTTNRSLLALQDLPAGGVITPANTALLRSEKNRTAGLSPDEYTLTLGKHLRRGVKGGNGITWEDLLQ